MPWVKGQSGNPSGKNQYSMSPQKKLFIAKCQDNWEKAWNIIEKSLAANESDDQRWGAEQLLDRGFGRPETSGSLDIQTNEPIPSPEQLIAGFGELKSIIAGRVKSVGFPKDTNGAVNPK